MKRKCHGSIGVLSTQAQVGIRLKCEVNAIDAWRLGIKKGFGDCQEPNMGKIMAQLGRVISYHLDGWNRCILSRRFRRKSCTPPLECKKPVNVLLLIKANSTIFLLH